MHALSVRFPSRPSSDARATVDLPARRVFKPTMDIGSLIAALLLGLVAGAIGRALVPNDAFSSMSGPASWAISTVLGLLGALVGYWVFTGLLGIGDDDRFDWGGLIGAIIGAVIVVALASMVMRRTGRRTV